LLVCLRFGQLQIFHGYIGLPLALQSLDAGGFGLVTGYLQIAQALNVVHGLSAVSEMQIFEDYLSAHPSVVAEATAGT
jgi:hypothetical protein